MTGRFSACADAIRKTSTKGKKNANIQLDLSSSLRNDIFRC